MNHDVSWGMTSTTRSMPKRGAKRAAASGMVMGFVLVNVVLWAAATVPRAVAEPPPTPGPGGSTIAGRCTQYEPALAQFAPPGGWDVPMMSSFMWRESKCTPEARSPTFDTGLLQINDVNHAHLRQVLGEWVGRWSLAEPTQNIRAAAALCRFWQAHGQSCYYPWKLVTTPAPAATPAPAPAPAPPAAPASVAGRCVSFEPVLAANAPVGGWDVAKMSRLMYSSSKCRPAANWRTATGLLRISTVNAAFLRSVLGETVNKQTLTDPTQNVRAASALCAEWRSKGRSCYAPWGGSG